ncbi:MAG: translocation/assembly module TamB domain-containing protein [Terriglobia bacterium]
MIKPKHILRIVLAFGLLLLILGAAAIALLRSQAFHRYVLAQMVARASQATGARVEIGDFQFRWSGLRVDLYQIVLHGSEAAVQPPLLQIDHLLVGLKIISIWQHKVDLSEIVIDHPSIHYSVDQNGRSNLTQPPQGGRGGGGTSIFDLAIGRFAVNHGELDYNDRQIPLDGELHDLHAQVSFDPVKTEYDGALWYRDGRVKFGSFNPVEHSLEVRFGATPSGATIESLALNAGASTVSAQGRLQGYGNPLVDGSYQADVSTQELGKILKAAPFPTGQVSVKGSVHFQNQVGRPLLDNLLISGQFRSPALAIKLPQARADIRALSGDFRVSDGNLEARNVRASVMGGSVSGEMTLTHLSERPMAKVTGALHDISLEALSAATNTTPLERAAISGNLNGTVAGSWEGAGQDVQLRSDLTIAATAPAQQGTGPGPNVIPLQGDVHLAYTARTATIAVSHSKLTTSHSSLTLDGSTGKQSSLNIEAQSDDLREVDQIVLIARHALEAGNPAAPIEPLGIAGSATFTGQLRGSPSDPQLTGQLTSSNLQYLGTTMTEVKTGVALGPSGITLSQSEIQTSEHAHARFDVAAGLTNWSYSPQSPVRMELTAERIPVATVERLTNQHYPISGTLAAHVSIHGSQSNVIGQGSATLTEASAWGQPIQNLSVQFQGAGDTVHSTIQLTAPAGSGSGKLTYEFNNQGYEVQFNFANIQLQRLAPDKSLELSGVATATVQGRGTLKDPQLTATLQAPKLVIGEQSLDGLNVHADLAHQQASFTLDSAAVGASIQAKGSVTLDANYSSHASVDVRNIQLGAVLPAFLHEVPPDLRGQAELHGTLHGPLKLRDQLEAEVEIPALSLNYQSLQIANASPIHALYRGGVISLDRCELKGTDTDLQVQAAIPLEHGRNMQATASGNVDLHLLKMLHPDWDSSGQVKLEVKAGGTFAHPDVNGTVQLVDASLQPPGVPLGAQSVNAALAIKNGRVDIERFTGQSGGGTFTVRGGATFQPALQFNVTLVAKTVRLRYPVGTRTILDGNLVLTGSGDSALLSGQVLVDRLSLTKDFDLSTFADQFTGNSSASAGPGFAQNVKLNVSLNSASEMALASSKLSVQGSANLMVRGTAADPVLLGRTDITGGELFFNGNRYIVESGVIQFVNPVRTEPVVNVLVTTTVNQFNLSMNFTGPIDRLRTTYTSDPPLAPIDIINLLATGQTTEAASTGSTSPESVIAGQLTSQFSSRVEKLAGITSLTIDPQVGGAQGNGGGRLAVQQRVTKNLFFTFSTDLTTSTGQIVQIEYQVSQKFAVSTIRDQNGGYTLQIKVHKSF